MEKRAYIAKHNEYEKEVSDVDVLFEERFVQRALLVPQVLAVDHVSDRARDRQVKHNDHHQCPDVGECCWQNDTIDHDAPNKADAHMTGQNVTDVPGSDEQVQRNGEQNQRHPLRSSQKIQLEQRLVERAVLCFGLEHTTWARNGRIRNEL